MWANRKRFRVIAGPNGSGKSTLRAWLTRDYAVNFYTFLNAENPAINEVRVANRFSQGGHPVPAEKIRARYTRSLAQIPTAIGCCSRAFFFDNSRASMRYLATYDESQGLMPKLAAAEFPAWFAKLAEKVSELSCNLSSTRAYTKQTEEQL